MIWQTLFLLSLHYKNDCSSNIELVWISTGKCFCFKFAQSKRILFLVITQNKKRHSAWFSFILLSANHSIATSVMLWTLPRVLFSWERIFLGVFFTLHFLVFPKLRTTSLSTTQLHNWKRLRTLNFVSVTHGCIYIHGYIYYIYIYIYIYLYIYNTYISLSFL